MNSTNRVNRRNSLGFSDRAVKNYPKTLAPTACSAVVFLAGKPENPDQGTDQYTRVVAGEKINKSRRDTAESCLTQIGACPFS